MALECPSLHYQHAEVFFCEEEWLPCPRLSAAEKGGVLLEEALGRWRWGRRGYSGQWVARSKRNPFWTCMAGVALLLLLMLFWVQLAQGFNLPPMQLTSPRYLFCRAGIVLIILRFWQNQFLLLLPPHLHSKLCWPVSSFEESIPEMLPLQFCQPGWLPSLSPWMSWPHWTPLYSSSSSNSLRSRRCWSKGLIWDFGAYCFAE